MVSQINGSVVKAFQILSLFGSGRDEISAGYLAERLKMNAVTAHRFLRTLETTGALVAVSKGTYRLGFALVDLGDRAADTVGLAKTVQPVLDGLAAMSCEGALATVFDGEMVVCIAKAAPDRPLFVDVRKGSRLEAYCTAQGKLWLAHLSPVKLARYFEIVERRAFTGTTVVSPEALTRDLEAARAEGVAFNDGEREDHIHGAAVPVLTRGGRMVCGLSIFGPPSRLTAASRPGLVRMLRDAAAEAERLLYGDLAAAGGPAAGTSADRPPRDRRQTAGRASVS